MAGQLGRGLDREEGNGGWPLTTCLLIHSEHWLIAEHKLSIGKTKPSNKWTNDLQMKSTQLAQMGKITSLCALVFRSFSLGKAEPPDSNSLSIDLYWDSTVTRKHMLPTKCFQAQAERIPLQVMILNPTLSTHKAHQNAGRGTENSKPSHPK